MANNFHDIGGWLVVGVDVHSAFLLPGIPLPPVPTYVPRLPHLNFLHPFSMGGNQKATVQFNGRPTVVHWHQPTRLWPHLNLPPFPIDILIPLHILFGQQTAWLPRGTVLIEDEVATCANLTGPASINLDCWDFANTPSSLVIQPSTVQTSPSLSDYVAGLQAFAIDLAINIILNKLSEVAVAAAVRGARGARNAIARAFADEAGDAGGSAAARNTANAVEGLFPPNRPPISPHVVDLAASEGNSPLQRSARLDVIDDFLHQHGAGRHLDDVLSGVDLNAPVRVVDFPPPPRLDQFVRTGDPLHPGFGQPGNWFDPIGGQSGDSLGLNVDPDFRSPRPFLVPPGPHQGLESTAAPVVDHWTDPANAVFTPGGGTQLFVPNETTELIANANPLTPPIEGVHDVAGNVVQNIIPAPDGGDLPQGP